MRKNKKVFILITFFILTIQVACNPCRNEKSHEEVNIPTNIKNSVLSFPKNTRWIFQSNLGDKDTVSLGAVQYSYLEGSCVDLKDCCTKYNNEGAQQLFNTVPDSDGLEKYTKQYNNGLHMISSSNSDLGFSSNQHFTSSYKSTYTINSKTITDIEVSEQNWIGIHPTIPYRAYWSLTYGLVHYEYKQLDGSTITYERIDL